MPLLATIRLLKYSDITSSTVKCALHPTKHVPSTTELYGISADNGNAPRRILNIWIRFITSRVSGWGYRIRAVFLSVCVCVCVHSHGRTGWRTDKKFCMYVMCVCVSIMPKGLSGKRTVHEGNAGGKSTLRRFHVNIYIPSVLVVIAFLSYRYSRQNQTTFLGNLYADN